MKDLLKEHLALGTHSGYKVQVKLLSEQDQPDEYMNAYVLKDSGKPYFDYDSMDINGEPYTEEYNDY